MKRKLFSNNVYFLLIAFLVIIFYSFKINEKEILSPKTTVIVLGDKPDYLESESAIRINKWLRKIYDIDTGFNIIKQSLLTETKGKTIIAVGNTKFSLKNNIQTLPSYTFIINKKGNIVTIQGVNSVATFTGTGYFLDHFCGVRFYMPGDLFTSLPKQKSIQLNKNIFIKEIPSTKYLLSTGYNGREETYWAYINGLIRKDWGSHQHSMGDRFFNDTIIKNFPEIFPVYKGQKYFPLSRTDQKWQPDFAEPKLIDAAVISTIKYFKSHPAIDYISFSVQDSHNYPAEGKMGQYLKSYQLTSAGQKRGYTDAYVEFLNKLAQRLETELPKNGITKPKTIVYIVYGKVNDIPKVKLHPNILPIKVFHIAETLMDSVYNEGGADFRAYLRLSEWAKVTTRIGNHDWAHGKGIIYPRIYTNLVSKFVRTVKKNKMDFEYAHIEAYPNWALDGIKYYFMAKIYWNPDVDPDSLLTQFCSDMFGKSKNKMKKYFSTLEDLNTSMNNDPTRNRRIAGYSTQLPLNEKEIQMVKQARQLIDEAAKAAKKDEEKRRIEFFSQGFKVSEYFFDIYNSKDLNNSKVTELKSFLKTIAGNGMMLHMAKGTDFVTKMNIIVDNVVKSKKQLLLK
ncbi:MAG: DUF4838 domain-containing protein [Chitinophagaceae bacterium]|nr:DUF4838 domain-containing protein [Chitinophagaceae bacterium]